MKALINFSILLVLIFAVGAGAPLWAGEALNTILLLDDFNQEQPLNLMGGENQGDEEEPGGLIPTYTPQGALSMGRLGHSLKMDYDVSIPMSLAFYWTKLGPRDGSGMPGATLPANLNQFNYISFWIKTDKQYPRFIMEIHRDVNEDKDQKY